MTKSTPHINIKDFHQTDFYKKASKKIETCQKLILRLIDYNEECKKEVFKTIKKSDLTEDLRWEQFYHTEQILRNIYFDTASLFNFYDVSVYMNAKGLDNKLLSLFESQRSYVVFNAIVRMSSILEYARKEFDGRENFTEYIKTNFSEISQSFFLLKDFRNTIHNNGKWKGKEALVYNLIEDGEIKEMRINKEEVLHYNHWLLYRLFKDTITLNMELAKRAEKKRLMKVKGYTNVYELQIDEKIDWDKVAMNYKTDFK